MDADLERGDSLLRLARYRLLWQDDFETLSLRSGGPREEGYASGSGVWAPRYWWTQADPSGCTLAGEAQWYVDPQFMQARGYPAQVSATNSILEIVAQRTPDALQPLLPNNPETGHPWGWISGVLHSKFSMRVSRPFYVEARAMAPKGDGLWSAFWLLSAERSWRRPNRPVTEVDVMEHLGRRSEWLNNALHWYTAADPHGVYHAEARYRPVGEDLSQAFHAYGVHCLPDRYDFYLDGRMTQSLRSPSDADATQPMYILLNLAVGASGSWAGAADGATPSPSVLRVDWVRVWGESGASLYLG